MDLLEFNEHTLYFDQPVPPAVEMLLKEASAAGVTETAELALLRAYVQAPTHLTVLVALYRYYFYAHRLNEALAVAEQARRVAAPALHFPDDWRDLDQLYLMGGARRSLGLLRFYLLALKAEGYLLLRLERYVEGCKRLLKVRELDEADRLGAGALLAVLEGCREVEQTPARAAM